MQNLRGVRRPHAAWFALTIVPIAVAALLTVNEFRGLSSEIRGMQRVVVPGEGVVTLDAGEHVAYGETASVVGGTAYHTSSFSTSCALVDDSSGEAVTLTATTGTTEYSLAGFSGTAMFDFTIPRAGAYRLTCTGDSTPAVIAIGDGLGWNIVRLVLIPLASLPVAALVALAVFLLRRRRATTIS